MTTFGIRAENDIILLKFMEESHRKLQIEDIVKNPFRGRIRKCVTDGKLVYYGCVINPIYPRIYLIGVALAVFPLFFVGLKVTLWSLPGALLYSTGFFWSKYFYYAVLRLGLRKRMYRKKVKLFNNRQFLEKILTEM